MQADAGDLDFRPCLELLSQLLSGPGVGGLRALALGRCLNTALSLQPIASDLFMQATSDAGSPACPAHSDDQEPSTLSCMGEHFKMHCASLWEESHMIAVENPLFIKIGA